MPASRTASSPMIAVRVRRAYRTDGSRKRRDAVADRLDARHRRAAAGERPHQDPQPTRPSAPRAGAAGATTGSGWPPDASVLIDPDRQHRQQRDDEEIGRDQERHARLPHAAQVHDRDERQGRQAERQRIGLEAGQRPRPGPRPPPRCPRPRRARSRASGPPRRAARPPCPRFSLATVYDPPPCG